jgi:hypothetical protein
MMMAPKPSLRGERLRLLNWLVTNSRLSKQMVSSRENPSHGEHSPPVAVMNDDDGTIVTVSKESTLQIPLPGMPSTGVFLHRQDIGWSRLRVPVLRWSCEL